jgi:hypothetical protein
MTDVREATHVKVNGQWERIVSKWGIRPDGALEPPSKGGFGCTTESGLKVDMWHAEAYKNENADG